MGAFGIISRDFKLHALALADKALLFQLERIAVMLLHGLQIKLTAGLQLLLQLRIKISLYEFKALHILLLFGIEQTALGFYIGDFFGAGSQPA